MGKKFKLKSLTTGKTFTVDEDNCFFLDYNELIKKGRFGRKKQYKYFCEHSEEIIDEKLFSELEEEFGNDEAEKKEV